MLSYETKDMSRDDIVHSTYVAANKLNEFKLKYQLIDQAGYEDIKWKIEQSIAYIEKIDILLALPEEEQAGELEKIHREIIDLNSYSICGKNELKWEVQKNYANFFSLALVGLEQLYVDYANKIRNQLQPKLRQQFKLDAEQRKIKV